MCFLKKVCSLFKVYGMCQKKKKKTKQKTRTKNLNKIVLHSPFFAMSNTVEYASRNYTYALQSYAIFSVLHIESCNLKQALSKLDKLI